MIIFLKWIIYTKISSGTVDKFQCEPTDLQINYEKLKIEEKMLFYDEVVLYEDELDDNGCTKLSVKLRVMPSGFFLLQRFYLRVDATLVRVHDTRQTCKRCWTMFYKTPGGFILVPFPF